MPQAQQVEEGREILRDTEASSTMRAASAKRSLTRAAPSSMEYSVCTCRCTKLSDEVAEEPAADMEELRDYGVGAMILTELGVEFVGVEPGARVSPVGWRELEVRRRGRAVPRQVLARATS